MPKRTTNIHITITIDVLSFILSFSPPQQRIAIARQRLSQGDTLAQAIQCGGGGRVTSFFISSCPLEWLSRSLGEKKKFLLFHIEHVQMETYCKTSLSIPVKVGHDNHNRMYTPVHEGIPSYVLWVSSPHSL